MRRRVRRTHLPRGALDQRAKGDFVPVLLKQVAKQHLQTGFVGRQREDLDNRAVGISNPFGPLDWCHSVSSLWPTAPPRAEREPQPGEDPQSESRRGKKQRRAAWPSGPA